MKQRANKEIFLVFSRDSRFLVNQDFRNKYVNMICPLILKEGQGTIN